MSPRCSPRLPSARSALQVLCLVVPITACESATPIVPSNFRPGPAASFNLSGQVLDVTPGGRVPAGGFSLHLAVRPSGGGTWTHADTTTSPDGHYNFSGLPAGSAVIVLYSATHEQVCGAAAALGAATQVDLDVEITSKANPQPSPTMPALRVTGQVYETTPAGRVGIGATPVLLEWQPDSTFLVVRTDADGRYTACGIPAGWPMEFSPWVWNHTYQEQSAWYQFSGDRTLDFELKRR